MTSEHSARPTISDVAAEAGVGRSTAARTLGGYGYASEEVRERVLAAAERIGYRANALARSVSTGVSHTLGLIVADLANPFFGGVARGISDASRERGFDTLVLSTHEDLAEEVAATNVLIDKRVDGIIVASAALEAGAAGHIEQARSSGIPVVLVDRAVPGLDIDAVVIDNRAAARDAVAHLVAAGHRRIGFVWGPPLAERPRRRRDLVGVGTGNQWTDGERLQGYLDALDDEGLAFDVELVMVGAKTEENAQAEVARMLELPEPPTALFCTENDAMTGSLRALRNAGSRVGETMSLIGFDDSSWAAVMEPPLSMIEQPTLALGAKAAEVLFATIDAGSRGGAPELHTLETRFIARASVAPPNVN
ncbi:LacI family DNA-binding transcriptional regulator [Zhihengliuella salsuginis]|uniref:LacI family transcriptional regulator n=1 Tax=Zhihengliuella salsuginis TaxID=578222 RepID=A0ABQ3GAL4_9MICC|nr:LacI family DNA-binding transcriptional regulator [Zhihengliuella salsuginis]GHC99611.1 LacI family transcriptional regulator [Zhihengliuella salsuginis]